MTDRPLPPDSEPTPDQPETSPGWPDTDAEALVSPPFSLPDDLAGEAAAARGPATNVPDSFASSSASVEPTHEPSVSPRSEDTLPSAALQTQPLPAQAVSDESVPDDELNDAVDDDLADEPLPGEPEAEDLDSELEEAVQNERQAAARNNQVRVSGTRRRAPSAYREPKTYTYAEEAPLERGGYGCADVITAVFLLASVTVCAVTVLLLVNPHSALNPLPPPTFPPVLVIATDLPTNTPTMTLTPAPATPTPLDTATFTPTVTQTPTWTPTATDTPVVGNFSRPSVTEAATTAASPQFTQSPFAFTVKAVRYTSHSGKEGCNWQSIAGSVVDLSGKAIKGLAVHVTGSNGNVDEVHYSGNFTDTGGRFGEGGFEAFLGGIARDDQYSLQLLGPTGSPISDLVTVQTKSDCKQNVAVVNFVQNHAY